LIPNPPNAASASKQGREGGGGKKRGRVERGSERIYHGLPSTSGSKKEEKKGKEEKARQASTVLVPTREQSENKSKTKNKHKIPFLPHTGNHLTPPSSA